MTVFGAYSRYYNLFYQSKDYAGEVEYLRTLFARHCPEARTVLDLGCGTGRHDHLLARMGYEVSGVDRSGEMLAVANAQPSTEETPVPPVFHLGDIRSVRLDRTFDAVISLFHVMSYLTSNEDLAAAFATVRAHLKPGGLFIFDCWYGPAVLTTRPEVRVKRLEDGEIAVTRIAEPLMLENDNLIEVQYQVLVRDKRTAEVQELDESHRMRYLFRPELDLLLGGAGLSLVTSAEWMTGNPPGFATWGVCFLVRG
jgi:SAM-dependent methyltransferase